MEHRMRLSFDLSLYLVTDRAMTASRGLVETVRAAAAGGATIVQLRDKEADDADLVARARALVEALAGTTLRVIVNDRADIAAAAGAHGVHLGQDDGDPARARALLGPGAIIGQSAGDLGELARVDPGLVDYVGIGPFASTATKGDAGAPLGAAGFARLRAATPLPAVAIGGIGPANAAQAIAAGADGVAVVSAICAASDPEAAARTLRAIVRAGAR
jgi:thiamine-phosphate pyrophosphorylase